MVAPITIVSAPSNYWFNQPHVFITNDPFNDRLLLACIHVLCHSTPLDCSNLCWSHHGVYQSLWWQFDTIQDVQCILLMPSACFFHSGVRARPYSVGTYTDAPTAVVLTAYNQPSNRAPPCLVQGTMIPNWVTAETGPRY